MANEQIETIVRAEIEASMKDYLARYPQDGEDLAYCIFFNNFHLSLPYGGRKELLEQSGDLDIPKVDGGKRTIRELYSDMDEIIEERGLDLNRFKVLQQEARKDIHKRRELLELAFPVYVMLRELGYTRKELNS